MTKFLQSMFYVGFCLATSFYSCGCSEHKNDAPQGSSPQAANPQGANFLPAGRYKISWKVGSYITEGVYVGLEMNDVEAEVYNSDEKTFLKIVKSEYRTGPPTEIKYKDGAIEFTGKCFTQDMLVFSGKLHGATVIGTLLGKLNDQDGYLDGKDTFTITKLDSK